MDGLSAAASVIAVIQLGQAIGGSLRGLYRDIRDARTEIEQLYDSVISLEIIVKTLDDLVKRRGVEMMNMRLLEDPEGPLQQALLEFRNVKDKLAVQTTNGRFERITMSLGQSAKRSLKWPFEKQEVLAIVERLKNHKSSLMMNTTVNTLAIQFDHSDILRDIRKEIAAAQDDDYRRRLIEWLSKSVPDPSVEHNNALKKQEETTGSWLIEGDELKEWMEAPNSFLWIHGNAGAGKSILCSTVIAHTQEQCMNEVNTAVVYWYFTFRDANTQRVDQCLRSLVTNLCSKRRDIPTAIQFAYEQANNGQLMPDTKTLMTMLSAAIDGFEHVFIVLDALDEFPKYTQEREDERAELLGRINEVYSWKKGCLHFAATSRKERDIEDYFLEQSEHDNFKAISIQGKHLEADIRKYIQSRLSSRHIKNWNRELKEEVELKLSSRADGMFRLVALQLDVLLKSPSTKSVREAMDTLPKTLDAFYDRTLLDIPIEDQHRAAKALQWLAFAARPLSIAELVEAIIIEPRQEPPFNPEERFMDQNYILDILPAGLVRTGMRSPLHSLSFDGWQAARLEDELYMEFAHFSVLEYLVSARMSFALRPIFQIHKIEAHTMMAESCLAYLLYIGGNEPEIADGFRNVIKPREEDLSQLDQEEINTEELHNRIQMSYNFADYANRAWYYHMSGFIFTGNENLDRLALDFLDVHCNSWAIWHGILFNDFRFATMDKSPSGYLEMIRFSHVYIRWAESLLHPVTYVSWLGYASLLKLLLRESPDLSRGKRTRYLGSPLHTACVQDNVGAVEILLSHGMDVNEQGGYSGLPLIAACRMGSLELVDLLLRSKADINAISITWNSFVNGTALATACARGSLEIVVLLLQNGANVNAVALNFKNQTALIAASENGHLDVVQLLLTKGVDINNAAQNKLRRTALIVASSNGHLKIVELLLKAGAEINETAQAKIDRTALIAASARGHLNIVKLLLKAGAEVNLKAKTPSFPTTVRTPRVAKLRTASIVKVKFLLICDLEFPGYSMDSLDSVYLMYQTALAAGSMFGSVEVVRLLLEHGADVNDSRGDINYKSPLQMALIGRNSDIIPVLLEHGANVGSEQEDGSPYQMALTLCFDPSYEDEGGKTVPSFREKVIRLFNDHLAKCQEAHTDPVLLTTSDQFPAMRP